MTSIILFIIVVPVLGIILLSVNFLLAPHNPYKEKKTPFECGYHSFLSQNRAQFNISFFIFGILFMIFDIEITSLLPWIVTTQFNKSFGFFVAMLFILILALGFVFELGKNALKFDSKQNRVNLESKININIFKNIYIIRKIKDFFYLYLEKFIEKNLINFFFIFLTNQYNLVAKASNLFLNLFILFIHLFSLHPNKTMLLIISHVFTGCCIYYTKDIYLSLVFFTHLAAICLLVYLLYINNTLKNKHYFIYYTLIVLMCVLIIFSLLFMLKSVFFFSLNIFKMFLKIIHQLKQDVYDWEKNVLYAKNSENSSGTWTVPSWMNPAGYGSKGAGKEHRNSDKSKNDSGNTNNPDENAQTEDDIDINSEEHKRNKKKEYFRAYNQRKKEERKKNPKLDEIHKKKQIEANKRYKDKNADNLEHNMRKSLYDKDWRARTTSERKKELDKASRQRHINKLREDGEYEDWLKEQNENRKFRNNVKKRKGIPLQDMDKKKEKDKLYSQTDKGKQSHREANKAYRARKKQKEIEKQKEREK